MNGKKLKVLDLFSGIGGFSLGLEAAGQFETAAFCEYDKKCQEILKLRWPDVPIIEDIGEINKNLLSNTVCQPSEKRGHDKSDAEKSRARGNNEGRSGSHDSRKLRAEQNESYRIDLITGGFPCQPASVAGKRAGREDERWLWPEMLRVIQLVQPTWVIAENVRGLLTLEDGLVFEHCLSDLEAIGYEHQTFVIPACAVNAQHRRDRVWVIAHGKEQFSNGRECGKYQDSRGQQWQAGGCSRKDVADTITNDAQGQFGKCPDQEIRRVQGERQTGSCSDGIGWGSTQPRLGRELDGLSYWLVEQGLPKVSKGVSGRTDRLKQLGNSIVPQIAYIIGSAILEAES